MSEGNIRHMYPGGNTPYGFFSFYDYILDSADAARIFVLKGGPGTGKSTLMRKIGLELAEMGYDMEFMHCSGDNNSLDGIVVPKLKIAMLDGTSPHVVDPVNPGAVDEIINLGAHWSSEGFAKSRKEIIETNKKIKDLFSTAYRYLKAAASLRADTERIYSSAFFKGKASVFTSDLKDLIFNGIKPEEVYGSQRKLFASAITPRGYSDFLDSICCTSKILRLSTPVGSSTRMILEAICHEALIRGFNTETYYCPMNPDRIEHIVIPDMDISLVTANEYHDISDLTICKTYNLNEFYDNDLLESGNKQLGFNRLYADALMQRAIETISEAKATHDELEKHYIPNMNFEEINKLRDEIIHQIVCCSRTEASIENGD